MGSCPICQWVYFGHGRGHHHPRLPAYPPRALLYLGATSYALYLIQLTEPVQWFFWLFLGKEMGITHMLWRAFGSANLLHLGRAL
ncbi:MAG: hypothetical protein IPL28_19260 [Chloroflexi bacterium]|nr:hypothetical protein [Chloroflexota bacterium]